MSVWMRLGCASLARNDLSKGMVEDTVISDDAPQREDRGSAVRILIIEARYYEDVADALLEGATAELKRHGISYDVITVPGALEIPLALNDAAGDGVIPSNDADGYDGAVVLGCVIRGETAHFDIVANNANHFLMETAIRNKIPLGNAVLTVENKQQALVRANGKNGPEDSKGAQAVRACLTLFSLHEQRMMSAEL